MPKPHKDESKEDFIGRCVPILINEGRDKDQAVAMCYSIWSEHNNE
jgi:hypothetical protein